MPLTTSLFPKISESKIHLFREPFLYGYVDNYLPDDLYQQLASDFIDPATHPQLDVLRRGKKRIVFRTPPVPDFIGESSRAWADTVEDVSSAAFLEDCWDWLHAFGDSAPQPAALYTSLMHERLKIDSSHLQMQCEFSSLEDGVLLPPHTDSTDKLISCVLYFTPPRWRQEWGGGTDVYEPLDSRRRANWHNVIIPRNEARTLYTSDYVPNRLFFFVKNCNSWHGVAPVLSPPGVQRRSFNFSLLIPKEVIAATPCASYEAEIKRTEATVFGR